MSDTHPTSNGVSGPEAKRAVENAPRDLRHLQKAAKTLAVLALQSARYSTDGDFQQAVDDVMHLTESVRL